MLTLRQFNIGPPVYAHLLDYDVMEDGQSIGRIREEREPKPGREWFWSLTITGAHRAGVPTWGYGASLEEVKAAFRASLDGYRAWLARDSRERLGDRPASMRTRPHPVAELFPMMADDELAELAADIKANGLVYPIVIDADDVLIDGRNRLKACAGIKPQFVKLNGRDPVAFILSVNVARRQMTKGAIAMVVAKAYPDPSAVGGRGKKGSVAEHFPMMTKPRLAEARAVLPTSTSPTPCSQARATRTRHGVNRWPDVERL